MDGLRKGNPVYFLQWMRLKGGLDKFYGFSVNTLRQH
jgi:hypothetical protein